MSNPAAYSGYQQGMAAIPAQGAINALGELIGNRAWDTFFYSADFGTIAANGTATREVAIQGDAVYLAFGATSVCFAAASPETLVPAKPFLITMENTGSGRNLTDRPQHLTNLTGDGNDPCWWPFYKWLDPKAVLNLNLSNLDTANGYRVLVTLLGVKVFDFPASPGRPGA